MCLPVLLANLTRLSKTRSCNECLCWERTSFRERLHRWKTDRPFVPDNWMSLARIRGLPLHCEVEHIYVSSCPTRNRTLHILRPCSRCEVETDCLHDGTSSLPDHWYKSGALRTVRGAVLVDFAPSHKVISLSLLSMKFTYPPMSRRLKPMADPQTAKDLQTLEGIYRNSSWLIHDLPEPLIGDQDCPYLAQRYGLPRRSCLTAFLNVQSDGSVKCRFERCFAFTFSAVDHGLKHLRDHHFGNRPFVCLPENGRIW